VNNEEYCVNGLLIHMTRHLLTRDTLQISANILVEGPLCVLTWPIQTYGQDIWPRDRSDHCARLCRIGV